MMDGADKQDVVDEAHHEGEFRARAVFGEIGAGEDADGRADQASR